MSPVARGSLIAVVVALLAVVPGTSHGSDLGQHCFNLLPFTDTLRLSLETTEGSATMVRALFRWRNSTAYQIAGTGVLTESILPGGAFELALVGSHNNGAIFGGNKICSMFAVLNPPAFGGAWQVTCTGAGPGLPVFTANGTIEVASCTAAADDHRSGPAMGQ